MFWTSNLYFFNYRELDFSHDQFRLKLDVQGQGGGRVLDVAGQGAGESSKLANFHGRHM